MDVITEKINRCESKGLEAPSLESHKITQSTQYPQTPEESNIRVVDLATRKAEATKTLQDLKKRTGRFWFFKSFRNFKLTSTIKRLDSLHKNQLFILEQLIKTKINPNGNTTITNSCHIRRINKFIDQLEEFPEIDSLSQIENLSEDGIILLFNNIRNGHRIVNIEDATDKLSQVINNPQSNPDIIQANGGLSRDQITEVQILYQNKNLSEQNKQERVKFIDEMFYNSQLEKDIKRNFYQFVILMDKTGLPEEVTAAYDDFIQYKTMLETMRKEDVEQTAEQQNLFLEKTKNLVFEIFEYDSNLGMQFMSIPTQSFDGNILSYEKSFAFNHFVEKDDILRSASYLRRAICLPRTYICNISSDKIIHSYRLIIDSINTKGREPPVSDDQGRVCWQIINNSVIECKISYVSDIKQNKLIFCKDSYLKRIFTNPPYSRLIVWEEADKCSIIKGKIKNDQVILE